MDAEKQSQLQPSSPRRREITTFLVPNLHCPTCTANIEEALYSLKPPPSSVSTSIISHTVTITHSAALSPSTLASALDEAGFEVFDVVPGTGLSRSKDATFRSRATGGRTREEHHGTPPSAFEQALQRWFPTVVATGANQNAAEEERRRRHIANCELCRVQSERADEGKALDDADPSSSEEKVQVVIGATDAAQLPSYKLTLAVDGMTCASCVGSVTRALEALPWVRSAQVNLMLHGATVMLEGEDHVDEVIEAVEDVGFGASLQSTERLGAKSASDYRTVSREWEAALAIDGMTCASCVNSISSALKELSFVKVADINLLTNSGSVKFTGVGQREADEIIARIEDAGFDAKLDNLVDLSTKRSDLPDRRTLSIQVAGMYCDHCPSKVMTALELLDADIEVTHTPTIKDPILTLTYRPNAPSLTVRHIIAAIADADADFSPSIHTPVSLEDRSKRMQRREQWHMLYRFSLALCAAIPTFIIGIVYMDLVASDNSTRLFFEQSVHGVMRSEIALFAIATPVYFFAADVFHRRTLKELRALWRPGSTVPLLRRFYRFGSMNMLISFGTTIAYFSSIAQFGLAASHPDADDSSLSNNTYFDSVVFLTMFLLLGRLIEAYSKAKTGNAVAELGKLRPSHAMLLESGTEKSVSTNLLDVGDVVRVPQGASPPFDGLVVDGTSLRFDESSLTGESRPVSKSIGDEVFSGTINKGSPASIRLTRVAGNSMLDQIINVVREGQARRAPVERVADAITGYFVPFVTMIAIITWIVWLALGTSGVLPLDYKGDQMGGWAFWSLEFAISVFVVACPCGIGLASPTALFVGGGLAAHHGILVKGGGEAFQEASGLDCIVFDKTGTLTMGGEPKVTDHEIVNVDEGLTEAEILGLVLVTENQSTHPIAKSLVEFCRSHASTSAKVLDASEVSGRGMFAKTTVSTTREVDVIVGNEALMTEYSVQLPDNLDQTLDQWKSQGKSVALVAIQRGAEAWRLAALFAISDPPRPEARAVVKELQRAHVDVWMLSGDNARTANAVGAQVGIPSTNVISQVLPSQKAEKIKHLQQSLPKRSSAWPSTSLRRRLGLRQGAGEGGQPRRATVAMVGDGINDAPALATADVGIAIGSGSDVAISSAAFVLVAADLRALLTLVRLARAVFRRIKVNFGWALVYNCIALPIAAGVLFPVTTASGSHVRLDPVWASLAMALSSISVVCSSLLLRSPLPWIGFRSEGARIDGFKDEGQIADKEETDNTEEQA